MKRSTAKLRIPTSAAFIAVICGVAFSTPANAAGFADFLNNIVKEFETAKQPLAIIALMITGVLYMFNIIDLRRTGYVVLGIIIIYAASELLTLITG